MIVFSSHHHTENSAGLLDSLIYMSSRFHRGEYDHNLAVKLLIGYGEFETAIMDQPDTDDTLKADLRITGKISGDIFRGSHLKDGTVSVSARLFSYNLIKLKTKSIPDTIKIKVPEGYAYYGVYPEMYLQAALDFYSTYQPERIVVIGIRSIGTSLSSVIWSAMDYLNVNASSFTIRPDGDPFNRKTSFTDLQLKNIQNNRNSYFLIVDEGPGLSGSSFSGTADELVKIGIDPFRIILFPSRMTPGDDLRSEKARFYWKKLDKRFTGFEEYWFRSGRFTELCGGYDYQEISAGNWRDLFWDNKKDYPAVFEQFERRKFILRDETGKIRYFIKFAGLGKYGEQVFRNAVQFAEAGFSPEVEKFDQGFIFYNYKKRSNGRRFDYNKLADFILDYLAYIKKHCPSKPSYTYEEMREMLYVNTSELLDKSFADKLMSLHFDPELFSSAVKNDGRMFPHEWIYGDSYLKTDNTDHYFDHLFPGSQDITWDIAAFFTEFNLGEQERLAFINRFTAISGDKHIRTKLNFIILEYLAFRLGYSSFASKNSSSAFDREKFSGMVNKYSERMYREAALQF